MNKVIQFCLFASLLLSSYFINAQMMNDGIFMAKGNLCGGVSYTKDSWKNYWEGSLYRDNKNLGTFTTQMVTLAGNYGISDRFNVMAMLPYVSVNASEGTSQGFKGLQDLTVSAKYRLIQARNLSVIGSVGGSIPTTNYVAESMPFCIGSQAKTLFGRGILYYTLPADLALTLVGTYTGRSNVRIDANMHYANGEAIFTNEVLMPNVTNFGGKFGHYSYRWQLEATYDQQITDGTDDIRRNFMPQICNKFDYTKVGFIAAYRIPQLKDLQVMFTGSRVVAGRNVGESTNFSVGFTKFIDLRKNKVAGIPSGPICRPGDKNHMGNMTEEKH